MSYWGLCDHYAGFGDQAYRVFNGNSLPYAATLNFYIRKDLFTKLNGFNEVYTSAGGEDRALLLARSSARRKNFLHSKSNCFSQSFSIISKICVDPPLHYGQVTVKFRGVNNSSNFTRRLGYSLIKLPILGKLHSSDLSTNINPFNPTTIPFQNNPYSSWNFFVGDCF